MKLGFGLYKHMLNRENFNFARQAGATHLVIHLVDYFRGGADRGDQPTGGDTGWGLAGDPDALWSVDQLLELRRGVEDAGLKLEAIENFDPAHWHDILLDGPCKKNHMENIKTLIRRVGQAGIPTIGYNFSIAGVAGRTTSPDGRGKAIVAGMDTPFDKPMPKGMTWNMVVDPEAMDETAPSATEEMLWARLEEFLGEVLPVAEEAGVHLAAHPDDPPMPTMRGQPRLVYQPALYQRLLDISPSPSNRLEFCVGTLAEMMEGDIYAVVDEYSREGRIAYVHLRNVSGKVPHYKETFLDDGDVDILRVLKILHGNGFDGVIIPDHAPQMSCDAPWHAGMAYAMGFLQAGRHILET